MKTVPSGNCWSGIEFVCFFFFRDPSTDSYASSLYLGIKSIQWMLLAGVFVLGLIIFIREKRWKSQEVSNDKVDFTGWRPFSLLLFLVLSYSFVHGWFEFLEQTLFLVILLPAICVTGWMMLGHFFDFRYRLKAALLSMVCLVTMSQTYIPENDSSKVRYFEIGVGGIIGKYKDFSAEAYKGTDCEGDVYYSLKNEKYYTYKVRMAGLDMSYNERKGRYKRMNIKLGGYFGFEDRQEIDSVPVERYRVLDINPSLSYSWRYGGLDVGFHAGDFGYAHVWPFTESFSRVIYNHDPDQHTDHYYHFLPHFGARIGPLNIAYFEGQFTKSFAIANPLMKFSLGVGSGLGRWDGRKVGLGYSTGGLYVTAAVPVKERYVIEGLFTENFKSGSENRYSLGLAFHYRFGYKEMNFPVTK